MTIEIAPDEPCLLAQRLVQRLRKDGLLEAGLSVIESRIKTDMFRGEAFRGTSGRYWWATPTGQPPFHQADDLGAAVEFLCKDLVRP